MADPSKLRGVLLGTAVGDALGLPWEGMSAALIARKNPGRLEYSFLRGRGVVSDDTEHSYLLAVAWLESDGEPERLRAAFARKLRCWLFAVPPGIGFATLRALARLAIGVPATRSGVWSAGNGPAMRSAFLGVACTSIDALPELVRAATTLTHTDPRAFEGALVIAMAAHLGAIHGRDDISIWSERIAECVRDPVLAESVRIAIHLGLSGGSADELTRRLGCPGFVTGFVNHTVPAAVFAWLRHEDFDAVIAESIRMGGDTDTVAAIAGALAGATGGEAAIPPQRIEHLRDWPISVDALRDVADRAARKADARPFPFLALAVRNAILFPLIVWHIATRRLFVPRRASADRS